MHADRFALKGATAYISHESCEKCSKTLAQAGIKRIVFREPYKNKWNKHFLKGIELVHLPKEK